MSTVVCSGSFDPITLGHMDVIRRAAACFDKVWVCISPNAEKMNPMFTQEEKLLLVRTAVAEFPNVDAELLTGLLAEYARSKGACCIVRGARDGTDFDEEYQLALINRGICPEVDTVVFPASARYQHYSSTMAREMIRYHQPLEQYLPASIVPLVREITEKEKGE